MNIFTKLGNIFSMTLICESCLLGCSVIQLALLHWYNVQYGFDQTSLRPSSSDKQTCNV